MTKWCWRKVWKDLALNRTGGCWNLCLALSYVQFVSVFLKTWLYKPIFGSSIRQSVGPSVGSSHLWFVHWAQIPRCRSCQCAWLSSHNTVPAHWRTTKVAVYPASYITAPAHRSPCIRFYSHLILFLLWQKAMSILGITEDTQHDIWRSLMAILHIGNIEFDDNGKGFAKVHDEQCKSNEE